jgi:hypothetical protein
MSEADSTPTIADASTSKVDHLLRIAQTLVSDWLRFQSLLKEGTIGWGCTAFKRELRSRAFAGFCQDYAEKPICGEHGPTVDYYFEGTVVEIALDLRNTNGQFERGILKVMMAQGEGHPVHRQVFLAKAGAKARARSAFRSALIAWAEREYGLEVEIRELGAMAEGIFDTPEE